ncbi:hypothetical protein BN14_00128 [Rhizoctonia solani AG-1 IB]|uniref:Uncharacterized protein n=1 Tax=Thanatephorus cucumeris (strain AG1-IB / isolate 7/3/14) TaxID=1108050 RepID=M5BI80_THACB|nr:hypothetical protein BN14_00128 [Rhizoctonia solani AG-1 IB]
MDRTRYNLTQSQASPPGHSVSDYPNSTRAHSRAPSLNRHDPGGSMTQTLPPLRPHDSEFSRPSNKSYIVVDSIDIAPSRDRNEWYYPTVRTVDEEETEPPTVHGKRHRGNWGNKMQANARWMKLGKCSSWGPSHAEWEMEERARKRLKRMLPPTESSEPPSPRLVHRRSPTPPSAAPYASPISIHSSFSSFVLDPSIQHSFHSTTINELERTASELIEGESALRRALGALFRAMDVEADQDRLRFALPKPPGASTTANGEPKPEPNGEMEDAEASALPLPPIYESNMLINQETQIETFEKSLAFLRELMDDGTEFTERLEEIREGLGTERAIRKGTWKAVRLRALQEMEGETNDSVDE